MLTTVTKKRKSAGEAAALTKKVKVAKSAEKPAPLKSALKKPKEQRVVEAVIKTSKAPKEKSKKRAEKTEETKIEETVVSPVEDEEEGGGELTADQTAELLAGFSSSEDEASDAEVEGIAIEKLPQAPRVKEVQKSIKNAKDSDPECTPGVIYVGRIPHGFFEHQMKAYFSQFGEITHLRLARNPKTGKSQHYAFVEFASKAVAEIVAKTMDKYLLFNHILQVRTVPQEQISENMGKGTGRRRKPAPRNRLEGGKLKRGMAKEDWDKRIEAEKLRREEKAEKLKELGYEFEMPALKSASEAKPSTKQIGDEADGGAEAADSPKRIESAGHDSKSEVEISKTVQEEPASVTVTEAKKEKKAGNKRAAAEVKKTVSKKIKKSKK
ncbi:RNA recognition motif (aka RRM, RBD, or RNP domain) [Teratosphaeria destructans]|uniref:RNA recognition motif (Aka RRM, RBD, or RNP domain) n=1 Tax=Teratosphaeria destructans TaxID=418781 RepID=A0A9W7W515_9PEZI|nr:RNA recognition motif (aka RRM, RBD, or RNP domain) [Teratosphaeria destructans]